MSCIFCQIIKKEIPAEIVYEDEKFLAFKDTNPRAPIHILIISKKHIESLNKAEEVDKGLISELLWRAKLLAEELEVDESGYKLILNCGKGAGQVIGHIHLHLLGGGSFKHWSI